MQNSNFYKIYHEFRKPCTEYKTDNNASCYEKASRSIQGSLDDSKILKDLYSNLFRIYASIPYTNNDYFDFDISEYQKMYCISLKYWLYDQIISEGLEETKINAIFHGWETYLKNKIKNKSPDLCIFHKLKKDEINMIKNIYALYAIFYDNTNISENCNNDKCKYIDYFGKGLDNLINSIKKCSSDSSNKEYCNEFNEFLEQCKNNIKQSGISIYQENNKGTSDTIGKYLLSVENYNDKPLYIYLKNDELLNFVKTSDFLSNKITTIAATSVVGSAIGLSSIFYYFYKVN
ncbi:hypothetical protein PVNG_06423 [Plasmodium vivax North Korean]|uniref:VIR protein n=1 Tax=Plasmodium vivax North Korean TaxID=1035514 RepID=A0A0J9TMY2_PLAVI|nr:hypothetical protein PVNG_06423 [Plasmodium vivax North Korean]